jgi:NAD(P)-dependent dehydrogenase (short-subunit alcohol dehydrogenase family)
MSTYVPPEKSSTIFEESTSSLDLTGKVVVITGTTTGLGFVAARTCALKGAAALILLNRPSERAAAAHDSIAALAGSGTDVVSVPCDLASFGSVREAMESVRQLPLVRSAGIDVLSLNAGVMGMPDVATVDGFDLQMQTNHLSHFLIVKELMAELDRAARGPAGESRVVSHTSAARFGPATTLSERYFSPSAGGRLGDEAMSRYNQSKLANAVFAYAFHERLAAAGSPIKSLVAEPGLAVTNLQHTTVAGGAGPPAEAFDEMMAGAQSAEDGAVPLLMCMASPDAESGDFFGPSIAGALGPYTTGPAEKHEPEPFCTSPENTRLLWTASERAIGEPLVIG